jgi:hypothetical protein
MGRQGGQSNRRFTEFETLDLESQKYPCQKSKDIEKERRVG